MPAKNFELTLKKYEPYILGGLGLVGCLWFASAVLFELVGANVMESRPWGMFQYFEYRMLGIYWIAVAAGIAPPLIFLAVKYMPTPEKLHGDARWARESDLKKSRLRAEGGIILGKQSGRYLSTVEPAHFLVCAPTRSGKGVGIIVPNLLDFNGSVIVHDIKFENWKLTSGVRAAHGHKVFLWSPMNPDATTHSYNPLDMIRDDAIFRISDVQSFVSYLIPLPKKDPIWDQLARFFLAGLVLYIIDAHRETGSPKTIGEIYRLINRHPDLNVWIEEISDLPWLDPECDRLLTSYAGMTDKERSFVRTSCAKVLNLWSNPLVDAATSTSDFDLRDMRRQRMSIYIGVSVDTKDAVAPLVALFMQQAIGALVQKEPDPETEPHKVLFMLDEFASMGRMEMVSNSVTMLASYGGRLMFILQALSTLDEHYGKDGREVILQNCAYQVFFAASDETTTKYVVGRLGKKTVKSTSTTRSKAGVTKSVKESGRDLMLPQEFQGMDRAKGVVLVESGRPVLSDKIKFFEDKDFIERVLEPAEVPMVRIEGSHLAPLIPVPDAEHPGVASTDANNMLIGATPKELVKTKPTVPAATSEPAQDAPQTATEAVAPPAAPVAEASAEAAPETPVAVPGEDTGETTVSDDEADIIAEGLADAAGETPAEIVNAGVAAVEDAPQGPVDDGLADMDSLMDASIAGEDEAPFEDDETPVEVAADETGSETGDDPDEEEASGEAQVAEVAKTGLAVLPGETSTDLREYNGFIGLFEGFRHPGIVELQATLPDHRV